MTPFWVVILGLLPLAYSLDNGLARVPPMGWMSWQRYRCIIDCENFPDECISEKLFATAADLLVSEGYAAAGYEYVIIDDCWLSHERDENGRLQPDHGRFPSGIKALANYIQNKGLKFGIYEDYGTYTCAGYPGIIDNLELDANTFADWDVDYVKLDGCYADIEDMDEGYPAFGNFLNKTGRPMVYSCSWPVYQEVNGMQPNLTKIAENCNLWRNYYDIQDSWASVEDIINWYGDNQDVIVPHAGPGHWNDPDMLIIGNYGLSLDQSRSQMAIWAILAAPLIMSNDLSAVRPEFKEILLNRDIIAINQDPLGIQGRRVEEKNSISLWVRPVLPIGETHSFAVAFFSRRSDGAPYPYTINLEYIGLTNPEGYLFKDLYGSDEFVLLPSSNHTVRVVPSGVVFYKATVLPKTQ